MNTYNNLKETKITNKLKNLIDATKMTSFKKIDKGAILKGSRFRETIEKYYREKLLCPLIETDLILIFEDYREIIDKNLIIAIEVKYFPPKKEIDLDKQLRQAYREFGQPLRNLIYGFDSIVLWHIFHEKVEDEKIKSYTNTVNKTINKLCLPMPYFATKLLDDKFKFYQPWNIDYNNIEYVLNYINNSCAEKRNPLTIEEIEKYRNAIKVTVGIP